MKTQRILKFTREGKVFVALTFGVGIAAINSGNNLLYLVLGMMLSLIVGSGILSEIVLYRLRVQRRLPQRLFARQPHLLGLQVTNPKRRLASYSIEVEDLTDGGPVGKACYFLKIPAQQQQKSVYRYQFPRRGPTRLAGVRLATRFPFSLFCKFRTLKAPQELLIYPAIYPLAGQERLRLGLGEQQSPRQGRQGEFVSLRDYRDGDDPRDIHWRKSAQLQRLLSREYETVSDRRVAIFLDNCQRSDFVTLQQLDEQEEAVSRAASLACYFIGEGIAVCLVTRGGGVRTGRGPQQLDRILRELALVAFLKQEQPYTWPARRAGDVIFIAPGRGSVG